MVELKDAIAKLKADVTSFEAFWLEAMDHNSEDFPSALPNQAEWFEQFVFWLNNQ